MGALLEQRERDRSVGGRKRESDRMSEREEWRGERGEKRQEWDREKQREIEGEGGRQREIRLRWRRTDRQIDGETEKNKLEMVTDIVEDTETDKE